MTLLARLLSFAAASALLLLSAPLWAGEEEDAAARAAELKEEGDEAMVDRRYQEALDKYDAAYELEPKPELHYNRGRAYESLGRFPEALEQLEAFADKAPESLKARVPKLEELLEEVRSKVAYLTIETAPAEARVLLDNELLGTTPIRNRAVNAGEATVEVFAEGHFSVEREVELEGQKTRALELELVPKDTSGMIRVEANVTGASVWIDDEELGQAPAESRAEPGTHKITVEAEGYEPFETSTTIEPGDDRLVEATLEPEPAVYERWWLWTSVGGGVAITVGVSLAVAFTTEREPERGTLDPGQIPVGFSFRF